MQPAKQDAPQCEPLQAACDKGRRPNRPRPEGLLRESASAVLRRLAMERTITCAPRLASVAFSQQRWCEMSVNTPWPLPLLTLHTRASSIKPLNN
jgi:hypothetical protein